MTEQLLQSDQIPLLEKLSTNAHSDSFQRRARIHLLYNAGRNTVEIPGTIGLAPRIEVLSRGMNIFSTNAEAEDSENADEELV
jgi:hypothetical protein